MLFERKITVISLFFLIVGLLIYPNYDSYIFLILKGIAISGLSLVFISYAFPNILKFNILNKEFGKDEGQEYLDEKSYSSEVKSHYQKLIQQVVNLISVVNSNYKTAVYMTDSENSGFKKQDLSNSDFIDFIDQDNDLFAMIIKNNKPSIINKNEKSEDWEQIVGKRKWRGSEAILGFPISYSDRVIGALIVFSDHFSLINKNDKNIIENLVNIIIKGMADLEQMESIMVDNYFTSRINNLFDQLEVKSNESELFESIRGICRAFFQYDKLTIVLSETENSANIKLVDGLHDDADEGQDFTLRKTLHGLAINANKIINSNSWLEDFPKFDRFFPGDTGDNDTFNFMSILSIPLKSSKVPIGAVTLERLKSRKYSNTDEKLLALLCSTVSTILDWQREYNRVHLSAMHDGLTGLLNHKTFLDRFDEEVSRAKRFNHNLGLVILDLDKFKLVNDNHGHLYGDYVLKSVSDIISDNTRAIDVVGRYGGEEFAVILVNTDIQACLPLAQRIVEKIAEKVFIKSGISVKISISAGMAGFPSHADNVRELFAMADTAMYVTKSKGGNSVTIAEV